MATPHEPPGQPSRIVLRVDRRRVQRRAPLHPLMEAWIAAMAPLGRPHLREKANRLRPLLDWCEREKVDPVAATAIDLGRFRDWLWDHWRTPDGREPAYHSKRHVLGMARGWYRWLRDAGHRVDDPAAEVLRLRPEEAAGPPARFIHTPLSPQMEAFLDWHRLRGRAATALAVDLALRQFSAWCGERGIDPLRLTRAQAEDYLAWITRICTTPQGRPLARQTASMRISFLKAWYGWLEERSEIVSNPAAKIGVRVPRSRVVVREYLTLQEATALVQTQAEAVIATTAHTVSWARRFRVLAAVCLGLATGRRIGGLLAIRVDQIDFDRQELRVEREKGSTGRVVPVAAWALAVVRAYLEGARPLLAAGRDLPWLFVGDTGGFTRSALMEALDDLVARTIAANPDLEELPQKTITWHSLRVSFATLLFANGCPIRSVNELMLHRDLSTTARYTPIPVEDLRAVFRGAHPRP